MSTLFDIWNTIQKQLFPSLEQELDPLSNKAWQIEQGNNLGSDERKKAA